MYFSEKECWHYSALWHRTKGWEVIICIETCFQYFIGSGLHAFDVLSKTCNPEQIFANFASQKFCENGGEENELKKWLKSAKNWTRFVKFLKKRPKKALFLLGDEKYDINLEFYPDFALNWAILHIYFPLCLYFVQFWQRNFGTQKPFSARKNWSILCFATFLAKSILYFMAQVIFS